MTHSLLLRAARAAVSVHFVPRVPGERFAGAVARARRCAPMLACAIPLFACALPGRAGAASADVAPAVVPARAAARTIVVSPAQVESLGIRLENPRPASAQRLSGLPAQVVVPVQQQRVVGAPLAGLIEQVDVLAGQTVRAGQVMAVMRSPAVAELQRGLVEAEVNAQLAAETARRDRALLDEGLIPEARARNARAQALAADAVLAERRQALQMAGVTPRGSAAVRIDGSLPLVAPVAGTVIDAQALPGGRVEAAAPLFRIARPGALGLEVQLPIALVASVQAGATVRIEPAGPSGVLEAIGQRLAPDSQTIPARVRLTEPGGLRIGQFVTVSVSGTASPGWRVPATAIAQLGDERWVFVRTADGFDPRRLRSVVADDSGTTVDAALTAGDRLAVSGVAELKAMFAAATAR